MYAIPDRLRPARHENGLELPIMCVWPSSPILRFRSSDLQGRAPDLGKACRNAGSSASATAIAFRIPVRYKTFVLITPRTARSWKAPQCADDNPVCTTCGECQHFVDRCGAPGIIFSRWLKWVEARLRDWAS